MGGESHLKIIFYFPKTSKNIFKKIKIKTFLKVVPIVRV